MNTCNVIGSGNNNKWRTPISIRGEALKYAHLCVLGYKVTLVSDGEYAAFSFYSPKDKESFSRDKGIEDAFKRLDEGPLNENVEVKNNKELPLDLLLRACANKISYLPGKFQRAYKRIVKHAENHIFSA